jgi:AsmA-like C-terminal region
MPRWARRMSRIILAVLLFIITAYVSLAWYINTHKQEVLASITAELNENLSGTLEIGDMDPTFLKGFPRVALRLENVLLKDSLYAAHGKILLKAGYIDISLNTLALVRGAIEIKKVAIGHASINMYTDTMGYSNTSVFKKRTKEGEGSGSFPELRQMELEDVALTIDNRKMGKLFDLAIDELDSSIDYTSDGWKADADLNTIVHSMAFSTRKGSFIKDKRVEGKFDISYREKDSLIVLKKNRLVIGGEDFKVGARFKSGGAAAGFSVNIENKSILWRNAANLLSPNITGKLEMFDLKKPISVKCDIIGDLNAKGDPLIRVNAEVEDNTLDTPGGGVGNCSFFGVFTNNHVKEKGFNDANSAIKLFNFKGDYSGIPILMKKVFILDLEKPIAVGDFSSGFEMEKLSSIIDDDLLKFTKGTADVKLDFRADIVDFKLSKPLVNGVVAIKDADVSYVPRKLDFKDVSVALDFTKDDLNISKIVLKSGKSIVNMEGSIKNFLNLYYTDPAKIVLTWNIYSPQLHLGEFMGFLGSRQRTTPIVKKTNKGNMTEDLNLLFERSNVDMKLRVDKLYYDRFLATDARADVLLTDNGVVVKNAGLKHGGGSLLINGMLAQTGKVNQYSLDAVISNVDINKFFYAFNNFGMETLGAQNLKGYVSSKANIKGSITSTGAMVPKSMYGTVTFTLKKGMLLNFGPLKNVGNFAFPNRDMENIEFYNLNGKLDVKGEKVTIHPMKINSSVINMDMEGTYSFGEGTQIYIDVPLRDPKRDKDITDEKELAERRNRGIVLHLKAVDDEDGKVKVKLGGKKD